MSKPDATELSRLELLRTRACCTFHEALEKRWPKDTLVAVLLTHRQRVPSIGRVLCADSDGRIAVRLDKPNRRGNLTVKRVHWRRVKS